MSKRKKSKNKLKKINSSKLTETENTENLKEENESEIDLIDNTNDDNDNNYDEIEDESLSDSDSDSDINNIIEDNECLFENNDNFYDSNVSINNFIVKKEDRITRPILTKFEYVRILTDRVKQLTLGAKPMIKNSKNYTHKEIAIMEIEMKVCPFLIERPLPNGQKEIFKLSELLIKKY